MHQQTRIGPVREHSRTLVDYFQILSSGDQRTWERAFNATWHPEAIVHGRDLSTVKDRHRRQLGTGRLEQVHITRHLAPHLIEYTTEVEGKREGPFVATFRDGRIYRIL